MFRSDSLIPLKSSLIFFYFHTMQCFAFILLLILFSSCSDNRQSVNDYSQNSKPRQATGYVVPKDSMAEPVVVEVDESKLRRVPVGKPKMLSDNNHVRLLGQPLIVKAGPPRIYTPGKDSFLLPLMVPATGIKIPAGTPEVVQVKDAYIKDRNPYGFSIFGKLQGLKQDVVKALLKDHDGNLWFGTGGGVSKYDGQNFTHYTEREGLVNNVILSALQDRKGNFWFGTFGGGLSRFDGKYFTNYTESKGFLHDYVSAIFEDKAGNLWFGTGNGVCKFDGQNFTFFTPKQGLNGTYVQSILQDRLGNLWFGTNEAGIFKFDGHVFSQFTTAEGLSDNYIWSITEDSRGNLWLGTENSGLCKYDGIYFSHYNEKHGIPGNTVQSIFQDRHGNLWIGTGGKGLAKISKIEHSSTEAYTIAQFTEKQGLSENLVFTFLEDVNGEIWIGTGLGVSRFAPRNFTHFTVDEGLSHNEIITTFKDNNGNLWFGTDGGGVMKFDGSNFYHFTEKEGLINNVVTTIFQDKDGNLWFGTKGGISKYNPSLTLNSNQGDFTCFTEKDGLVNNAVRSIVQDINGNFWIGTQSGICRFDGSKFTHFTKKQGLSGDFVWTITQDKKGNLWCGTLDGGVTKIVLDKIQESESYRFIHFTPKEGLSGIKVHSILQDENGRMWFSNLGAGVSIFTPSDSNQEEKGQFRYITEKDGLCSDFVLNLFQAKNKSMYFGTRFGLSSISTENLQKFFNESDSDLSADHINSFKNFLHEDGFLSVGVQGGKSMVQDDEGAIWIGGNDRLTVLRPDLSSADTIAPKIQLRSVELFNEPIPWLALTTNQDSILKLKNGMQVSKYHFSTLSPWYNLPENLSLYYNNNYISFKFIGITTNQPKKVKYQFKLEGMDENWSGLTSRNEAHYGNIPPGSYTFFVKAMNSKGVWSKPFEYSFTIRPPWWKTWWAYSFYSLAFVVSLVSFVKTREKNFKSRQKELEIEVSNATKVIRNQKEVVENKNREILDSIEYAKRIQTAILPPPRLVKELLKNSFILYLPKDIVAGDFYWMESIDNKVYFAACDCTGHGVPGAMVSVVCNNALNRSFHEFALRDPGAIFDKTRDLLFENFSKGDESVRDGMDASLCCLDLSKMLISWSGANNPLWIFRSQENMIEEIKPDKQPIGAGHVQNPFTTQKLNIQKNDIIYLFTDGFSDQFGGLKNKKLTKLKFKEILLKLACLTMEEQHEKLLSFINEYRGANEQIDDICVIGVKV
ncbi:MAG: hypothetical protein RLZZ46_1237 [Bacteroidota bacterium]